jgi:antitoxin ParD1/3/4
MADMVRDKVESGQYASESEVIRDGLRVLLTRDRATEHWLREEVAPAYDAMKSGKSGTFSAGQMRPALKDPLRGT